MATEQLSTMPSLRVLELYSGIGGMHWALKGSHVNYEVVMAIDINTTANQVYQHNFPSTCLQSFGLEKLSLRKLESLDVQAILMSPPCQPFTRVGKKGDCEDVRTKSFLHILQLLQLLKKKPQYILVENVKGFETSQTRDKLMECLDSCGYVHQEFLLTPLQFGIPNSRLRYYMIAKCGGPFFFEAQSNMMTTIPSRPNTTTSDTILVHHIDERRTCENNSERHERHLSSDVDRLCDGDLRDSCREAELSNERQSALEGGNRSELCKNDIDRKCDSSSRGDKTSSNISSTATSTLCDTFHKHSSTLGFMSQGNSDGNASGLNDLKDAGRNMRYCEEEDEFINEDSRPLTEFMEAGSYSDFKDYWLSHKELRQFVVMDIVFPALKKSTCFTKRYGHYIEGAGSVVQMSQDAKDVKAASDFKSQVVELKNKSEWGEEEFNILRKLKLRYFTPREVANLMCFPAEFTFPDGLSAIQKYRVLGNSLNVYVVSELIKILVS